MNTASTSECRPGERIGKCATCGVDLPLRAPPAGQRGMSWICTGCGSCYHGVLTEDTSPQAIQHIRPAAIQFDRSNLLHPPQAIAQFIRNRLSEKFYVYRGPERRYSQRHPLVAPVIAMPISDTFQPAGEAFMVMVRNISTKGVALISTRAVNTKLLAIELGAASTDSMQLVVRVLRCRIIDRFYEIAGSFLTRMDH